MCLFTLILMCLRADTSNWKLQTVVLWRIGRKRALRAAVRQMSATLQSRSTREEL